MSDPVARFLREYGASAVGATPPQPNIPVDEEGEEQKAVIDRQFEVNEDAWQPQTVSEAPAKGGEFPVRFIDGSHFGQPVLCLETRPDGYRIPMYLAEVGAVALRTVDRHFEREFAAVERVLSFYADPFPWEQVEEFAAAVANKPELDLRLVPANRPEGKYSPFDYELMRTQAYNRAQKEMQYLERLALAADRTVPTLIDGPLDDVVGNPDPASPLLIGITKRQFGSYLHAHGYRTLYALRPGQRSPVVRINRPGSPEVATWFLKLAGGPQLAPNWGYVRVEVPWGQFEKQFGGDFGFVNRLSRWLIDARCRTDSYARMPVSLDPIVRAEDALKPLFTPLQLLVNRLYRQAGLFRRNES
jgi:hypothetical protein